MRRGADGALHFVDRLKNIIRRAGENIAALEVEAALAGHPAISQVAVIAVPDPMRDEEVMACVVLRSTPRLVRTPRSRSRTGASSAWPTSRRRATSLFVEALPTTATNKVQKAKLADFAFKAADSFDLRERKKRTAAKSV